MAKYPTMHQLRMALRSECRILYIDPEKCLYRDFGNGFDVEICGVSRPNRNCPADLYMWFKDDASRVLMVKTMKGVGRDADSIDAAVDKLYRLSERLLAAGYNDRNSLHEILDRLKTDEDFP